MDLTRLRRADGLAVAHPVLTYLALAAFLVLVFVLVPVTLGGPINWALVVILGVLFPALLIWRVRRRESQTSS